MALRIELGNCKARAVSPLFIVDIRSRGAQARDVADALRAMVARLGTLHADRTAVVTSSGLAKLQAMRVADKDAEVFTSMVLARDWIFEQISLANEESVVHDEPSAADAQGLVVHVHGPSDLDVTFTPKAALQTAKHIGDAAAEALVELAAQSGTATRYAA